jgi:hypothetical protein
VRPSGLRSDLVFCVLEEEERWVEVEVRSVGQWVPEKYLMRRRGVCRMHVFWGPMKSRDSIWC